jgi:translation elongation factor EF-G
MMGVCFVVENIVLYDYHDCHNDPQNISLPSTTITTTTTTTTITTTTTTTTPPRHEQVMMNINNSTTTDLSSETSSSLQIVSDEWQNMSLFKGQVISAVKEACRQAVTRRSQRLMEAYYLCDIVLDGSEAYGKAHAVLAKRRAKILSDEVRQGTYMYNLRAYLPAVESFGFAEELFSKTSGACQTQMMFSHWALLDEDPDFVPLSEEEVAEMGDLQNQPPNLARRYVDAIRKRKVSSSSPPLLFSILSSLLHLPQLRHLFCKFQFFCLSF